MSWPNRFNRVALWRTWDQLHVYLAALHFLEKGWRIEKEKLLFFYWEHKMSLLA